MQISEIIALVIGAVTAILILVFLVKNQKNKVCEWLVYAVTEAEKLLGSGTGQLKLRQVYDWFTDKFGFIAAILPFKVFSAWVDVALGTMRNMLDKNTAVSCYVSKEA